MTLSYKRFNNFIKYFFILLRGYPLLGDTSSSHHRVMGQTGHDDVRLKTPKI